MVWSAASLPGSSSVRASSASVYFTSKGNDWLRMGSDRVCARRVCRSDGVGVIHDRSPAVFVSAERQRQAEGQDQAHEAQQGALQHAGGLPETVVMFSPRLSHEQTTER